MPITYGPVIGKWVGAIATMITFAIFSFGNTMKKEEPSFDCLVSKGFHLPLPASVLETTTNADNYTNVTSRFMTAFLMAFWINFLKAVVFIPLEFYYTHKKRQEEAGSFKIADGEEEGQVEVLPGPIKALTSILGISELVWIILVLVFRNTFSGKVCSGDFLHGADFIETHSTGKVAVDTFVDVAAGNILWFMTIFLSIMLSIMGLCMIIFCAHMCNKKAKEAKEA